MLGSSGISVLKQEELVVLHQVAIHLGEERVESNFLHPLSLDESCDVKLLLDKALCILRTLRSHAAEEPVTEVNSEFAPEWHPRANLSKFRIGRVRAVIGQFSFLSEDLG